AAGALQAHRVPGVIHFEFGTRNDDVDKGAVGRGVCASEHYPKSMIDAATKLPSSFDPEAAFDGARRALRREGARDQAVAAAAKNFVLGRFGKRTHAPVMSAHDHQHPA